MLLEPESMLGVMGGARVYASLVILVSALGPRGLDLDLDQGLTIQSRNPKENKQKLKP